MQEAQATAGVSLMKTLNKLFCLILSVHVVIHGPSQFLAFWLILEYLLSALHKRKKT